MNKSRLAFISIIVSLFAAFTLQAGVKISDSESDQKPATEDKEKPASEEKATPATVQVEHTVALRVADGSFVTASPSGTLDFTGKKIGSKQTFTISPVNGGELADGAEVKIRYTPNSGGVPDPSKASYWHEGKEGIVRKRDGDVFKIKKVDGKYSFQTQGGRFVTGTVTDGALALSEKKESALLVEFVDPQSAASKSKAKAAD